MTGCDKCGAFVSSYTSLDGLTILCPACQQAILDQKEKLLTAPPPLSPRIVPIWNWLMENTIPFRVEANKETQTVVFYGSGELFSITSLLTSWPKIDEKHIPKGLLGFGAATTERDLDGTPTHVSIQAHQQDRCLIVIEEYGCWVKVQVQLTLFPLPHQEQPTAFQ